MAVFLTYNPTFSLDKLRQTRQGKVAELRLELNSGGKKDKNYGAKKVALKRIVANMTMSNNDMVALFPDIISCMNLPSLEIKKMYVDRQIYGKVTLGGNTLLTVFTGVFCIWSTTHECDQKLPLRQFQYYNMLVNPPLHPPLESLTLITYNFIGYGR